MKNQTLHPVLSSRRPLLLLCVELPPLKINKQVWENMNAAFEKATTKLKIIKKL